MSRLISDLNPDVRWLCNSHFENCRKENITILVYNTKRTMQEQALLFASGRKIEELPILVAELIPEKINSWKKNGFIFAPGSVVTNTMESNHLSGNAYDCVPEVDGEAIWDNDELWNKIGNIGKKLGLTWGGDWKDFPDKPHFELKR